MKSKEMQNSTKISVKQEKLIALLLTERTIEDACAKAKVNVSTYWRWMQNATFMYEYRRVRRGILENTIARLQGCTHLAIETLERNLTCENPGAEIRAAQIILEQSIRGLEILDLENRLEVLESIFANEEKYK
jgi:hypothetical protein